ncbi:MAG: Ca-activated chloride channel family protein [Planctomycetota bacterium]|jgi:Ca-activated chloride channel family protein
MSAIFADIELVWLIVVPIAMVGVWLWNEATRKRILADLIGKRLIPDMIVGSSGERRFWKLLIRTVAVLLIALAIMRPQWGEKRIDIERKGIDIALVVDTSKSMLAEDVQPSRMERVKQELSYFVENTLREDRVSLVAFAGTARALCPLTLDRAAFEIFLDELDVGVIPQGGTDLGRAIEAALDSFGDDVRNHKAILLLSDGEAHAGIPEKTIDQANKRGVRIYTIGVGNEEGVRIPLEDDDGSRIYLRDNEGNVVTTRLEARILKTIAQRSLDGAYVSLTVGRDNLQKIYLDNIKKIEERELKSSKQVRQIDRFQWFLAAALILLMFDGLIPEGRPRRSSSNVSEQRRAA